MNSPSRVVVLGMSGGLDSSLAASLLKEQGYDPVGVTLSLWRSGSRCCSEKDVDDARRVCEGLDIPHYTVCDETKFERVVVNYFTNEYARGRTPNPCVVCNERVKFRMLLHRAMEMGANYIATGHYARVEHDVGSDFFLLKRGVDRTKDQSYFLATLPQPIMRRVVFPIGSITKEEVRKKASSRGLHVGGKSESQEVCFVRKGEQVSFLEQRIGRQDGKIVGEDGEVLGSHTGIYKYTIGQRKGLGVSRGYPLYVTGLDEREKKVLVGREDSLLSKTAVIERVHFMAPNRGSEVQVEAKIRYGGRPQPARFEQLEETKAKLTFEVPQRAVTPGQLAVAYVGDTVYASGWIATGS